MFQTLTASFKMLLLFFLVLAFVSPVQAQQVLVKEDTMVTKFYDLYGKPLFWFSSAENLKRATEWLLVLETSEHYGIVPSRTESNQIRVALLGNSSLDNNFKAERDRQITGLVLHFLKELQEGNIKFDYDEVRQFRDSVYIRQLLNSKIPETVPEEIAKLESKESEYLLLKKFLNDSVLVTDSVRYRKIAMAMNYSRYFSVNHQPERVVVNIPETGVKYYQNDLLKEKMRAVVGKKLTPTPTIASYITDIVTFPHWNVPHSIAVKEILPQVQTKENYLEQHSYDVVDGRGHVVDESTINWKKYDEKNFPYYFRQSTGSRNSLGILKFDLQNPYSIFLHATSWQGAFALNYRFLSHGCVRLEKPFVLADRLLRGEIDINKLKKGKKNTAPKTIALPHKVAVFVVYNPVLVEGKKIIFLPDTYGLLQ